MKLKTENSVAINVLLNVIKTLMSVLFPLITFPYATRVLHVENIGKVSFASSIVAYFALIATLGINTYAVREGGKIRDNKEKFSKFANEVINVNIFTTIISYLLLIITIIIFPKIHSYSSLIMLISISIVFTTIGLEWVNVVYEEYLIITIRSILIYIINLILLFLFVKTKNDYYVYAFLSVFSTIFVSIWNFIYCRKYIKFKLFDFSFIYFKKHLQPMIVLFANNLAITIYCNADSTMIGWINSDYYVGIYSVAVKIYNILKTILAAIYIVFIPRLSYITGKNNNRKFKNMINHILSILILFLFPVITGLIILAKPIVLFLSGQEYFEAIVTLQILSVAVFFAIIGGVITNCIVIPLGKESLALKATVIAAITNISLNFIMIPLYKQNGAAITTVIAEFIVIAVCFVFDKAVRDVFYWKKLSIQLIHSGIGSSFVFGIGYFILTYNLNNLLTCILTIAFSIIFYLIFLFIVKNKYLLSLIEKIG